MPSIAAAAAAFALLAGSASAGSVQHAAYVEAEQAVSGARMELDDARTYLDELKSGNFAGIYSIADDGSMRCGEVESNPACAPLTDADKAQAIAEAEEMVTSATAAVEDADVQFASLKSASHKAIASSD
jgi:multidrug efflux pump subunit AcrA (membrane-fusion protein)